MSSETSTETVRLSASARSASADPSKLAGTPAASGGGKAHGDNNSLQPWQFFVLAALGCATAALFASRGQGIAAVVLLTVLMGATALVGLGVLRALRPLVSPEDDSTSMIGQRTRVALEREKMLALRSIKELEFDRAMGKLSDSDWHEMSGRLRARASRLMRQLDAGSGYRDQIERDLAKRLGQAAAAKDPVSVPSSTQAAACASCATVNDPDARFCKECGQKL
jgi:hypothetical protein